MAVIKVRGRLEPIVIKNEIAQKVKDRWLGLNNVEKADAKDVVDLDVWAGEYGRITEIEMTNESKPAASDTHAEKMERERQEAKERWANMTPVEKSQSLGRFKLLYIKVHNWAKPSEEILKKAEKIQLDYYKKNPDAESVPNEMFAAIIPRVGKPSGNGTPKGQCPICHTVVTETIYCSGKCQLAAKNG